MHPLIHTTRKRISSWHLQLSQREKLIFGLTSIVLCLFVIFGSWIVASSVIDSLKVKIARGKSQAQELTAKLNRYNELNVTYKKLQQQFEQSQSTFEDVAVTLDNVREKSKIKKEDFEFATGSIVDIGLEYKKQEYTLTVNSLSLEELVTLLYTIEEAAKSLFIGEVDILKTPGKDIFRAEISISNIRKASS
jgi:hypothetical protein